MKLPIRLSNDSREPIYHQIEKQLKALIAGGHLLADTPLPSIRVLASDLKVSVITTRRAYQNLEAQGFIRTVQGKGTFVAKVEQKVKKQVKVEKVSQVFKEAIETAFTFDYTEEEIKDIFDQELASYHKNKGGK